MQGSLKHSFSAAFVSSSYKENGISCLARLNFTSGEVCRLRKGNNSYTLVCFMEPKEQAEVVCEVLGNIWGSEGVWGSWKLYLLSKGAGRECHQSDDTGILLQTWGGLCWWLTDKVVKNRHHLVVIFVSNPCFVIYVMILMLNQPLIRRWSGAVRMKQKVHITWIWALSCEQTKFVLGVTPARSPQKVRKAAFKEWWHWPSWGGETGGAQQESVPGPVLFSISHNSSVE